MNIQAVGHPESDADEDFADKIASSLTDDELELAIIFAKYLIASRDAPELPRLR